MSRSASHSAPTEAGVFRVGKDGKVKIDFLFDGGAYHGEVAIFSLEGMGRLQPGSNDYIREAVSRALSNSERGRVVISDRREGAKFSGSLGEGNLNDGPYLGPKTFQMRPGDTVGFMLVPDGTISSLMEHHKKGSGQTPFFSFASANPNRTVQLTQAAEGVLAWEDIWLGSKSDRDYNDIVFSVYGLTGTAAPFKEYVSRGKDWRDFKFGKEIINSAICPVPEPDRTPPTITAALLRDTAPGGTTNTDRVTSDPTITGTLTDQSQIVEFRAGFSSTPESSYVNVLTSRGADGRFTFDLAQLERIYGGILRDGVYTLQLRAKDEFGNGSSLAITFTLDTITPAPTVDLLPSSDTGISNSDNVTRDNTPTIAGTAEAGAIVQLFSNNTLINQAAATNTGIWEFTTPSLTDGVYSVRAIATDIAGNVSPFSTPLVITIDTALPTLSLAQPLDTQPLTLQSRLVGSASGTGSTIVAMSYRFNGLAEVPVSFNAQGAFDQLLDLRGVANGNHTLTVTVTDQAGNTKVSQFAVNVSAEEVITLREGQLFEVKLDRALTTLQQPSVLSFTFNANFDLTDLDSIKDAFEVALVDETGKPLVHSIDLQRDSFFNLSEGQIAALGAGIRLNQQTVSLDLPALPQGKNAKLIFRLVNNDQDTNTVVTITNLQVQNGGQGVRSAVPLVSRTYPTIPPDFTHLANVSPSLSAQYGRTSFNADTQVLYSDVSIRNQGTYPVRGQLLVVVKNLSDPSVRVMDADGFTPEGLPYYDFTSLLNNRLLNLGQTSQSRSLAFYNPNGVQFTYDLEFLGETNQAPTFSTNPDVEALVGRSYVYDADAIDPNRDPLTYKLLIGPQGLAVDAATGVVSWTPAITDLGTHTVTLEVSDGFGGTAQQTYILNVVNNVPNRPPTFTSVPIVDGRVNTPYTYDVNAIDPDSDTLSYRLISGPTGMTIDASTGIIAWRPLANQLGPQAVKVEVADGRGGIANQEFAIQVLQEQGNHAPVIVSQPIVELSPTITNRTSVEFVNFSDLTGLKLDGNARTANPALRDGKSVLRLTESVDWRSGSVLLQNPFKLVGQNGERLSFKTSFQFQITDPGGILDGDGPGADGIVFVISPVDTVGSSGGGIGYGGLARSVGIEFDTYQNFDLFDVSGNHIGINTNGSLISLASRSVEADRLNNGQAWYSWVEYDGSNQQLEVRISQTPIRPTEAFVSRQLDIASVLGQEDFFVGFVSATGAARGTHDILSWSFETGAFSKEAKEYQYSVVAVDADQDSLTYSLTQSPTGMTIDPVSGVISWRPTELVSNAQIPVRVRVNDGRGGFDTQEYIITVSDTLPGEIRGTTFLDLNGNGIWNQEPLLPKLSVSGTDAIFLAGRTDVTIPPLGTFDPFFPLGRYGYVLPDFLQERFPQAISVEPGEVFSFAVDGGIDFFHGTGSFSKPDGVDTSGSNHPGIAGISGYRGPGAALVGVFLSDANPLGSLPPATLDFTPSGIGTGFSNLSPQLGQIFFVGDGLTGNGVGDSQKFIAPSGATRLYLGLVDGFVFGGSPGAYEDNNGFYEVAVQRFFVSQNSTLVPASNIETGLAGARVYLDLNNNGFLDSNEPTQVTASDDPTTSTINEAGQYRFTGLQPGTYVVREVIPPGYVQTFPGSQGSSPNSHRVALSAAQVIENINFGIRPTGNLLPNTAPAFTTTAPTTAQTGTLLRYNAIARDQDNDSLTYDLPVKPEGMTVDSTWGTVVWQPTFDQAGRTYDVVLRVRDGRGGAALQSFQLAVPIANTAPTITSTPTTTAVAGLPYQYRVRAQDAEGDILTFQLAQGPEGATIDGRTGVLNFRPTIPQLGNQLFSVVVNDGKGGTATQTFTLGIVADAPNSPPTITSTPRGRATLDSPYAYQVEAIDPNGDPLTFNLITVPSGLTISETGLITWSPTAAQFGVNSIGVQVSDGRGGIATQNFVVEVGSQGNNQSPTITSTPIATGTVNREYQYNLAARDPEGDPLQWTLEAAPTGMSIDSQRGSIRWLPTVDQLGKQNVTVRVFDSFGGFATQAFEVMVRGANTPPVITSTPFTQAAINRPYTYTVTATDSDNDPLTFTLLNAPVGMALDAQTGVIQWTPAINQQGLQSVDLLVRDGQGGTATQTFALSVLSAPANNAPVITSTPKFLATVGGNYTYTATSLDPDGDPLRFQLLESPTGMTINPTTGLLQWTPGLDQQGTRFITIAATDPFGASGTQRFPLQVRVNNAPQITSTPITTATADGLYRYDIRATDPNADPLSFTLLRGPNGMTLDQLGRLTWAPKLSDLGTYQVQVAVADPFNATTTQTYNLTVSPDQTAPLVNLVVSKNRVDIGSSVNVQVLATDNVGVKTLTLRVNGSPIALDAQGRATLQVNALGTWNLSAIATDAAGNTGSAQSQVFAINPADTTAPTVAFSTLIDGAIFTAPERIIGTVSDDNLLFYSLSLRPSVGGNFTEIARDTNSINNGFLGTFDPSTLQNDSYILRLTATDAGGLTSTVEREVSAAGDLKLGNFRLSFTDLSIPVSGIPIQVTRTYDTLTSNTTDDFGYGWRMEFRDTDLRTSLAPTGSEEFGVYAAFREGTRVYITTPGGRREGFTFRPEVAPGWFGRLFGAYRPVFVPDAGVTSTLTVQNMDLRRVGNEYFAYYGSTPYNPADPGVGSAYTLSTKEGLTYQIDSGDGDLLSMSDRNGNTLTFTDAAITSSTGQRVTFERDVQGRITAVIDPTGNRVTYQYDALGDLVAVTDRTGNVTRFDYNDRRLHYLDEVIDPLGRSGVRNEYDSAGRLVQMIDAAGNPVQLIHDPSNSIERVRDQLGNVTTYEYDQRGNVVTEINALGGTTRRTYDGNNNMLTETDPLGRTTTFTYDSRGNTLTETDPLGNVTRYTYDNFGNVLTTTDPTGQTITNTYDARGNLTQITGQGSGPLTFSYDAFGNLTSMRDGSGATTFEYDARGNITRQTNALGHVTTYTYDANGNRLTETTTQTTPTGVRTLVTQMVYDAQGRLIQTTNPEGGVTRTIYNAAGKRVEEIDALGRSTRYVYDDRGLLIQTIYPDATPNDLTDNPRTRTEYDAAGRVVAEIDELGRRTQFVYDALGRRIATIYPDATPTIDTDNPRTRTEYDAAGRVAAQIDERGNRTEFRYDTAGRLIETIYPDATPNDLSDNPRMRSTYDAAGRQLTQTDALGRTTTSLYDDLGRPIGQVYADGTRTSVTFDAAGRVAGRTDQAGRTTRFEYDALGRLTAVIDALGQRTQYTYNELGGLISQRDANGNVTRYEYDGLGRRTAEVLPLGQRSSTAYDAVGNTIQTTNFNGETITYTYNPRNWLVAKDLPGTEFDVSYTYTLDGQRQTVTDSRGVTTYAYDARNQLLERVDPDGRRIGYTYDLAGNRTSVIIPSGITTYTFDAQNRLSTVTDPQGGVTTYTYDLMGNLVRTTLPNNTVETRQYNSLNRLLYLENSGPNGIINSFRYMLDPTGNRTAVQENDGRRVNYTYDALYRLTQEAITNAGATNPTRTIGYSYDPVGNRLSRNDSGSGVTTYSYDANDRLLNSITNGVATTYTYDSNGNTISRTTGGNRVTYQWNAENRLIGADTNADGTIDVTNRYNEDGIRVSQTVNGQETRFLIDANRDYAQVLEEYTPSGSVNVSYVYGHDLISQNRSGERFFYHVDALGSTRALSDMNGITTNVYVYDAYGEVLRKTGSVANSYLFTGEQQDSSIDLVYLRARYLDVENARFLGRDIFEGIQSKPVTLHKYLYSNGNPTNFTDPSGLFSIGEVSSTVSNLQSSALNSARQIESGRRAIQLAQKIAAAFGTVIVAKPNTNVDEDDGRLNVMRVQLQRGNVDNFSRPIINFSPEGIRVREVQAYLDYFYLLIDDEVTFLSPSREDRNIRSAIIEVSDQLNKFPPAGVTGDKNVARSTFIGSTKPREEYRIDVENKSGHNLRSF